MSRPSNSRKELLQEIERLRGCIAELEASRPAAPEETLRNVAERKAAVQALLQSQEVLRQVLLDHDRQLQALADEIHNALAQQLQAAVGELEESQRLHHEGKAEAAEAFRHGLALVRETLEETRRLIGRLRSPTANDPTS